MRNRLILCLLICAVMLYYAVPRLTIHFSGIDGVFAFSWFLLAFFVIGGNLAGFLYSEKKKKKIQLRLERARKVRKFVAEH
ncbi:hypothetical protein [Bacillus suaedaesalsae]|uniref:DUF2627 domain-containing protein n=1 Tax=Bacillus suaedaesalsae TaxID=2810349 RepID=A0ABS2DIZ2_9BACI|nr:hypothetical protein [Bacillus suaedaesalsae]MBM6617473.1 hypothetical protein [Bacillus suaedaesalsae]